MPQSNILFRTGAAISLMKAAVQASQKVTDAFLVAPHKLAPPSDGLG
jgi:hypothetical protein